MAKYTYPALFKKNELKGYCVNFPDIQGCFTEGVNMKEAEIMAKEALSLTLYDFEISGIAIPPVSVGDIKKSDDEIVKQITCDTACFKEMDSSAVKIVSVEPRKRIPARKIYTAKVVAPAPKKATAFIAKKA
jgi:predicted RNase H-like HicB family nuclease